MHTFQGADCASLNAGYGMFCAGHMRATLGCAHRPQDRASADVLSQPCWVTPLLCMQAERQLLRLSGLSVLHAVPCRLPCRSSNACAAPFRQQCLTICRRISHILCAVPAGHRAGALEPVQSYRQHPGTLHPQRPQRAESWVRLRDLCQPLPGPAGDHAAQRQASAPGQSPCSQASGPIPPQQAGSSVARQLLSTCTGIAAWQHTEASCRNTMRSPYTLPPQLTMLWWARPLLGHPHAQTETFEQLHVQ